MELHSAYKQKFKDDEMVVISFFLVKEEYLYCVNYYHKVRALDRRFDDEVNGWKLKTDSVEETIAACPVRGKNYI